MKAAILVEQNKPLVIAEIDLPEELEVGQVLVKVHYSGICGSQLGEISGAKGPDPYLPHLMGHEGSGTVVEVGPGVKYHKEGDNVVMHWKPSRGIEAVPPKYTWKGKVVNAGFVTTFNEYAIVSENRLTSLPDDFNLELAPLFGCANPTGFGVICNDAELKIGESIVIFGAGGVGLNEIQAASMTSAYPIIAVDIVENKLDMAKKFGATHVLDSTKCDIVKEILKITKGDELDVIVDNTGNTDVIAQAYDLSKPQGRVILVGVPRKGDKAKLYTLPLHFGKVIKGSHGGAAKPHEDIPRFIKLYEAGLLNLKGLITDRFDFNEINDALDKMRCGEIAGRCLIKINPDL